MHGALHAMPKLPLSLSNVLKALCCMHVVPSPYGVGVYEDIQESTTLIISVTALPNGSGKLVTNCKSGDPLHFLVLRLMLARCLVSILAFLFGS